MVSDSGTNLFHSLNEVFVPTGSVAYFNNALDIQNIITGLRDLFLILMAQDSSWSAANYFTKPQWDYFGPTLTEHRRSV